MTKGCALCGSNDIENPEKYLKRYSKYHNSKKKIKPLHEKIKFLTGYQGKIDVKNLYLKKDFHEYTCSIQL